MSASGALWFGVVGGGGGGGVGFYFEGGRRGLEGGHSQSHIITTTHDGSVRKGETGSLQLLLARCFVRAQPFKCAEVEKNEFTA